MLLENFYNITETENFNSEDNFSAIIQFNSEHKIFQGHFPENPVVPGVCLIQIIKEIIELKYNAGFNLTNGDNIKFKSMINPIVNNKIQLSFSKTDTIDKYKFKCKAYSKENTFFTFTGSFKKTD